MSFKALYMLKFLCITSQPSDFHILNFHCFLPLLPFSLLHAPHLPHPLWTVIIRPPPAPPLSQHFPTLKVQFAFCALQEDRTHRVQIVIAVAAQRPSACLCDLEWTLSEKSVS